MGWTPHSQNRLNSAKSWIPHSQNVGKALQPASSPQVSAGLLVSLARVVLRLFEAFVLLSGETRGLVEVAPAVGTCLLNAELKVQQGGFF